MWARAASWGCTSSGHWGQQGAHDQDQRRTRAAARVKHLHTQGLPQGALGVVVIGP
jgi:hypothetical protein